MHEVHTVTVALESTSPYSQSRPHNTPKLDRETAHDWEQRTWRERCHADEGGQIYVPQNVFKMCLQEAAKYLSMPIKGKGGKATYTKHFECGVMTVEDSLLKDKKGKQYMKENCEGNPLFVAADGKPGGPRVWRTFPIFREWKATATFMILDALITKEIFYEHMAVAGRFIGIGQFRPRNRGHFGRFEVAKIDWK